MPPPLPIGYSVVIVDGASTLARRIQKPRKHAVTGSRPLNCVHLDACFLVAPLLRLLASVTSDSEPPPYAGYEQRAYPLDKAEQDGASIHLDPRLNVWFHFLIRLYSNSTLSIVRPSRMRI